LSEGALFALAKAAHPSTLVHLKAKQQQQQNKNTRKTKAAARTRTLGARSHGYGSTATQSSRRDAIRTAKREEEDEGGRARAVASTSPQMRRTAISPQGLPVTDFTGRVSRRGGRGRPASVEEHQPSLPKRGKGRQEPPLSLLHGRAPNHGLVARRKGKGTGTGTAAAAGLLRSGRWVFRSASCLFLHSEHPR